MIFLKRLFTWWHGYTLNTQLYTWRKGKLVGTDIQGNKFYQNRNGDKRWVLYNGEAEASRINVDWHGWLHYTYDKTPNQLPLSHKSWEKPHKKNLTGTNLAYTPPGSMRSLTPKVPRISYKSWSPDVESGPG